MTIHPVLHLLGTAGAHGSGIARIVGALARGLDPSPYRVHAWFLGERGPLVRELELSCVEVRVLEWNRGIRDPRGALRFWRQLRGHRFPIIHQHFGGRSVRWIARRAIDTTIIVHLHGRVNEADGSIPNPNPVSGADKVIAVSQAVARRVSGAPAAVVYPGVPVSRHAPKWMGRATHGAEVVIGAACRLVRIKGIAFLIEALNALRSDCPNIRLEVAGSGPMQKILEDQVSALRLSDCVKFLGWRDDLDRLMSGWDIFANAPVEEGFGIAVLEAMACGLPVVATAVGGIPEVVKHGQTGWLVQAGDAAGFAKYLRELVDDAELRQRLGSAGRDRARECFSIERAASAISNIYAEAIASSCRRPALPV